MTTLEEQLSDVRGKIGLKEQEIVSTKALPVNDHERNKQLTELNKQLTLLQQEELLLWKEKGNALHDADNLKEFIDMDAVIPDHHFYVQPSQLEHLLPLVADSTSAYYVVCDGRQMGKTTFALAMKRALLQKGRLVHMIALGDSMPKATPAAFYSYLGDLLARNSPDRFAAGAITDMNTFISALQCRPQQREYFLVDEAAALTMLPSDILNTWLDIVRDLKNHAFDHNVGGILLFGTWAVTQLLEEHNRLLPIPGIPSRTSPFKASCLLSVQRFTPEDVTDLLLQYVRQQQHFSSSATLSEEDARAVAASIHCLTNGVKGLTGICCREVSMHQMSSRAQWDKHSSSKLVAHVTGHAVFKKISAALGTAFSVQRLDGRLAMPEAGQPSAASHGNLTLQQQAQAGIAHSSSTTTPHEVMTAVVMHGYCDVEAGLLPQLDKLIQAGLLVPISSDGRTPRWDYPDNEFVTVRLALSAPLVGACILYRLRMQAISTTDPPTDGGVDMRWLLTQVVRNLNMNTIMAKEARNANGNPAEYAFQSQFYLLLSDLLCRFHPAYQLVAEARKLDVPGYSRRRLDLLALGGGLPTYAWELLSCGDSRQVEEHVMRATRYRDMHNAQVVYVVNLTTQDDVEQLHYPRVMPDGVQLVHVVLLPSITAATVAWPGEQPEQVALAHPQGQLLIYRPSDFY